MNGYEYTLISTEPVAHCPTVRRHVFRRPGGVCIELTCRAAEFGGGDQEFEFVVGKVYRIAAAAIPNDTAAALTAELGRLFRFDRGPGE